MIAFHGHSIVGSWGKRDKWRYRPRRRSEVCPAHWWQTPATIENLSSFIQDPEAPIDEIEIACARLEEILEQPQAVLDATYYKSIASKDTKIHCKVETKPSLDQMIIGQQPERPLDYLLPYSLRHRPFSQQLIGADFILKMKRCGIFYDMRVGKTLTATLALKYALVNGLVDHAFIICPRILIEGVWLDELEANGIDAYVCDRGPVRDDKVFSHVDADAYIMSYETLVGRMASINCHFDTSRIMVICDETSRIKNPVAKRTKAVQKLTYHAPYVAMLTGTPMEQGPHDVWSQMFTIDRGARLGVTFDSFATKYTLQEGHKFTVNPDKRLDLEVAIQTAALRYVRSEADQFAGKDKNFRWIQLSPSAEQAHATELAIDAQVQTLNGEYHELIPHILTIYGFLREICCGYNKVRLDELDPYTRFRFEYDAKTLWLETWLESNPGEPAVVFCEYDEHEHMIADMLDKNGIKHVWLKRDGKKLGPAECVRQFQDGEVHVIMMKTTQAEGITLNRIPAVEKGVGAYPSIIYMAPTWSLGRFMQSQDRCVGTDSDGRNLMTPIYCLIIKGSIEEKIMGALRQKKGVQETLLRDAKRVGFTSFLDELRLDPTDGAGDGTFDAQEMYSRKVLGLSPELRATHRKIMSVCPTVETDSCYDGDSPEHQRLRAAQYLMEKYDEQGALLVPHTEGKPEYAVIEATTWEES